MVSRKEPTLGERVLREWVEPERPVPPVPRAGESHFRRLLEKLPAGAYTCDPEGLITYYNQHAVELWGRAPSLNDPVDRYCGSFKLYTTDGVPISHDRCWMALALKNDREYNRREIVVERPDGRRLTALAHANPIHDEAGNLIGAVNVLVDITDRKKAEEALRMVREAERSRIARELHDGVLQDLAAVVQGLEAARVEQGRSGSPVISIDPQQEIDTLRRAVSGLRQAIYDLRSEKVLPFLKAVESLVELNRQQTPEREIRLVVRDGFPKDPEDRIGRELLRIIQEALTNTRRHSAARSIRIILGLEEPGFLLAEVSDDGRGFDSMSSTPGVGVQSMRERASLLGGDVTLRSMPGRGTSVRARVPNST